MKKTGNSIRRIREQKEMKPIGLIADVEHDYTRFEEVIEFKMSIGNTIKRLRKKKGITLKDMAKLTGIQVATLSRIENDKMEGDLNTYMLIAGGLDLKLSQLFAAIEEDGGLK